MAIAAVEAALAFFFGASMASFINVVADRWPRGESILHPPSHCPACGRPLTPLELVPVLSYVALRGRCRGCRSSIPLRVLAMELALGLLALYLGRTYGASGAAVALFGLCALLLLIAAIDVEHGIIPHALVYPGLGLALLLSPWWAHMGIGREFWGSDSPGRLLLSALAAGALGAAVFAAIILLYPRGMGWGDVPMAALVGAANGIPGAAVALLLAVLSGGLAASLLLLLRLRSPRQSIPFGPFLAAGGVVALLWGDAVWSWYRSLW